MMQTALVLHALENAVTVTSVDWRIVALATALYVVLLAFIFRPRLSRAARRRTLRAAAGVLVVLALLPSVLPYDHLLPAAHAHEAAEVHDLHCHGTPGSCADAPLAAGPGQLFPSGELLVAVTLTSLLLLASSPILRGIARRPELRPPLLVPA